MRQRRMEGRRMDSSSFDRANFDAPAGSRIQEAGSRRASSCPTIADSDDGLGDRQPLSKESLPKGTVAQVPSDQRSEVQSGGARGRSFRSSSGDSLKLSDFSAKMRDLTMPEPNTRPSAARSAEIARSFVGQALQVPQTVALVAVIWAACSAAVVYVFLALEGRRVLLEAKDAELHAHDVAQRFEQTVDSMLDPARALAAFLPFEQALRESGSLVIGKPFGRPRTLERPIPKQVSDKFFSIADHIMTLHSRFETSSLLSFLLQPDAFVVDAYPPCGAPGSNKVCMVGFDMFASHWKEGEAREVYDVSREVLLAIEKNDWKMEPPRQVILDFDRYAPYQVAHYRKIQNASMSMGGRLPIFMDESWGIGLNTSSIRGIEREIAPGKLFWGFITMIFDFDVVLNVTGVTDFDGQSAFLYRIYRQQPAPNGTIDEIPVFETLTNRSWERPVTSRDFKVADMTWNIKLVAKDVSGRGAFVVQLVPSLLLVALGSVLLLVALISRAQNSRLLEKAKQAMNEMFAVSSELQTLIQTANAPIFGTDATGLINEWNNMCAQITGQPREFALGLRFERHFVTRGPLQKKVQQAIANALLGKDTMGLECSVVVADNNHEEEEGSGKDSVAHLLLNVATRRSADDEIVGCIAIAQDVSSWRKVLEQEAALAKATSANHAKSQFLATMSHEMRTPLNVVGGMASMLADTELSHEQWTFTQQIRKSCEVLLHLVNSILDLAKVEGGGMSLSPVDFDARTVLEDVVDASSSADTKGLEVCLDMDSLEDYQVHGDSKIFRQVATNLIANAVKFTEGGYVRVVAEVEQEVDTHRIFRLSVHDTGIGIEKEDIKLLFQRFSQIDSSKTRAYGGTGLGLAICKEFSEMMGGVMQVDSEAGKGSVFSLRVPLAFTKLAPEMRVPALTPLPGLANVKVVVSYDLAQEPRGLGMLEKVTDSMLEEFGAKPLRVASVQACGDMQEGPDIVVVCLPVVRKGGDCSGLHESVGQLLTLQQRHPAFQAIIVCPAALQTEASAYMRLPGCFFVVRPLRAAVFRDVLQDALSRLSQSESDSRWSKASLLNSVEPRVGHEVLVLCRQVKARTVLHSLLNMCGYSCVARASWDQAADFAAATPSFTVVVSCPREEAEETRSWHVVGCIRAWQERESRSSSFGGSARPFANRHVFVVCVVDRLDTEEAPLCLEAGADKVLCKLPSIADLTGALGSSSPLQSDSASKNKKVKSAAAPGISPGGAALPKSSLAQLKVAAAVAPGTVEGGGGGDGDTVDGSSVKCLSAHGSLNNYGSRAGGGGSSDRSSKGSLDRAGHLNNKSLSSSSVTGRPSSESPPLRHRQMAAAQPGVGFRPPSNQAMKMADLMSGFSRASQEEGGSWAAGEGGSVGTASECGLELTNRNARVLVCDDDEGQRLLLKMMLEKEGLTVETAVDGAEAVRMVLERREGEAALQLVIIDCYLPVMTGPEATAAIRAHLGRERLPIIGLTGATEPENEERCKEAGMDIVMAKPFQRKELSRVVSSFLADTQQQQTRRARSDESRQEVVASRSSSVMADGGWGGRGGAVGGSDIKKAPQGGVRVLLFVADKSTKTIISAVLKKLGAEVSTASSKDQALLMVGAGAWSLVIMEALDEAHEEAGWRVLLDSVRAADKPVPVVCLTSQLLQQPEREASLLAAGFAAVIAKPIKAPDAKALLARILASADEPVEDSPISGISPLPSSCSDARMWSGDGHGSGEPRVRSYASMKILVVDDHDANLLLICSMLKKRKYKTQTAHDGVEAVAAAEREKFDIVLMDCNMPNMDGWCATEAIRAGDGPNKATPVVAVTANAMVGDRENCLARGMDDYISKPVTRDALYDMIDHHTAPRPAESPPSNNHEDDWCGVGLGDQ